MTAHGSEGLGSLASAFADPDPAFGPVPLWWLDGEELTDERLTDQLESIAANGVSGVCILSKHPTGWDGARPSYFTEEWWGHVEHITKECDRLGMDLWVHDATYHTSPPRWYAFWQDRIRTEAGGNADLRGRVLHRVSANVEDGESVVLDLPDDFEVCSVSAYPRRTDGSIDLDEMVDVTVVESRVEWHGEERHEPDHDGWHVAAVGTRREGLCYTSPAVVERYIDLHYEEYVRRLGDLVGDVLVGTFEDELKILEGTIPCDERVLSQFRAMHGYDPSKALIALYEPCDATARLRTEYYAVVVSMLEENWFRPLYDWHEDHGLKRAHDNWGRNDIPEGTQMYGDYFRTMRWYQVPGYDDGGPKAIGYRNFFDAKLASSIAACYDRDRVWGELFHSTTWGFRPDNQLAGLVENVCYGCTLHDNHGLYYSTRGGWWEHAPPDVHFRQPYWEDVGQLADAATRLSRLFSDGTPVVDVALSFPVPSMHADWHPEDGIGSLGQEIDERTQELAASLYGDGLDLVLVDDATLAEAASDGFLAFGGMEIPCLVLPPTTAIAAETLETALELYESGGVVVAAGRLPVHLVHAGDLDSTGTTDIETALSTLFGDDYAAANRGLVNGRTVTEHSSGGVAVFTSEPADVADLVRSIVDPSIRVDIVGQDGSNRSVAGSAERPTFPDRPSADVYHLHRTIAGGDAEAYLLFNVHDAPCTARVELRTEGRPERWDPITGDMTTLDAFERVDGSIRLEIEFDPHDFWVVVVDTTVDEDGPHLVEGRLDAAAIDRSSRDDADPGDPPAGEHAHDGPLVSGYASDGGDLRLRAMDVEDSYVGRVRTPGPTVVDVVGRWEFELQPSLNNRWGDYRYPPSDELIGAEVKQLEHRREHPDEDGVDQGWHRPNLETEDWVSVLPTYGPYFYRKRGSDSTGPGPTTDVADENDAVGWEPYEFSLRLGTPGTHPYLLGYMSTVSENYLVSPPADEDEIDTTYFWTNLRVPDEGAYLLHYGPGVRTVRLGIREFETERGMEGDWGLKMPPSPGGGSLAIHLPAGSTPLLLAVEPDVETYVAFDPVPRSARDRDMTDIPRVRWFHEEGQGELTFDPRPNEVSVGWYRFDVPVGTSSFTVPIRGEARVWVDGEERAIEDGRVRLDHPCPAPTPVAVRIEQDPGAYGGATWREPIAVETAPVRIDLADWHDLGLGSYSGRARYRTTVTLPEFGEGDRITLALGDVVATASVSLNGEPVDSVFSRPFALDVSHVATPGENRLDIEVANTLANHFEHETPLVYGSLTRAWKAHLPVLPETDLDEQYISGLLGPVTIRIDPLVEVELGPE